MLPFLCNNMSVDVLNILQNLRPMLDMAKIPGSDTLYI